jgi:Domain of unknown function (DUF1906)
MKRGPTLRLVFLTLAASIPACAQTYLGFDRNDYPGDANLKTLRQTFAYAGYWLNIPPGAKANSWPGHRSTVEAAGFGFLVLFNGRLYAELKSEANAQRMGKSDGSTAVSSARREGFPLGTIIFLDQEQGGRMLPEQKAYIYAWVDAIIAAGFRAGIYCSGMASPDEQHVATAQDIRQNAGSRQITYWAINYGCPPSPGCSFPQRPPSPAKSGVDFAEVWQFAQSPERKDVPGHCTNYNSDGNCYPPGTSASQGLHVDLNTSNSPDPSHGRIR